MGRNKAMLPHPAGGTYADHAIGRLTGLCDHVCFAGQSLPDQGSVTVIEDPVRYRGPATGIASALSFAWHNGCQACLVTPLDMPLLQMDDLARLRRAWTRESKLCCAVVEQTKRLQPLVAIYPAALRAEIQQLADSENRSLRRWIEDRGFTQVTLSADACRNINTPEDLSSGPEIPI
jgi:molybdopterin-guanine dinucleotide biosynthesis protein A